MITRGKDHNVKTISVRRCGANHSNALRQYQPTCHDKCRDKHAYGYASKCPWLPANRPINKSIISRRRADRWRAPPASQLPRVSLSSIPGTGTPQWRTADGRSAIPKPDSSCPGAIENPLCTNTKTPQAGTPRCRKRKHGYRPGGQKQSDSSQELRPAPDPPE